MKCDEWQILAILISYEINPRPGIKILHILHLHSTGFQDFIFVFNSPNVLECFMSEGICVHSCGPLKDSVSEPYATVRIFSVLKEESYRRLYGLLDKTNVVCMNYGERSCFTLNISVASFCRFLWCTETELSISNNWEKDKLLSL